VIRINAAIAIDEREIEESFLRSPGPGGQNVNKLETAVQLRFDVRRSPSLPEPVRRRLELMAGQRLTKDGVLILTARSHRTRERNRADALQKLVELIRKATVVQRPRRPTRPTKASKERRLETKERRSRNKQLRQTRLDD
jgi:ribosome-associated protein